MTQIIKTSFSAFLLVCLSSSASAAIYTYEVSHKPSPFSNQKYKYKLIIDTDTKEGSLVGGPKLNGINAKFTSDEFANFGGGLKPTGTFNLQTLEGTRTINGNTYTPYATTHPFQLNFNGTGAVNLWGYWQYGNGYTSGDFDVNIDSMTFYQPDLGGTDISEPGLLGLLTLGVGGLLFGRRRRRADMKEILATS